MSMGLISVKVADDREIVMLHRQEGSDVPLIHQIWAARTYDLNRLRRWGDLQEELNTLRGRGRRPLVIDAGANMGASPLFFADFILQSHVIAVEPEPRNFELLSHNAKQSSNIACVHGAIAARRGQLGVCDPQHGDVGFRTCTLDPSRPADLTWTGTSVEAYSVRDLIDMAPADCEPFLIKIDIEGGEQDLFSRNTSWIDLFPIIIIELHDWMLPGVSNSKNFLSAIAPMGRDFVQLGENTVSIRN